VNFPETIAGSVATAAARQGYRVCNASVGGHSLPSQLELARWLVTEKQLKPSRFVLLLTPVMINSSDHLNRAVVGEDGRLYGAKVDLNAKARLWVKTHSVIYSRIRDAVRNCGIGVDPTKDSDTVLAFYTKGPHEHAESSLCSTISDFKKFASSIGATVDMVYLPLTVEGDFPSLEKVAAKRGLMLDPDASFQIAGSVAKHLELRLLDLRPVMNEIRASGAALNVKGDFHYSSELSLACGSNLISELHLNIQNPNRS